MSTWICTVTFCGWGVKAGMAHSICACMCGWQVKLCDPSLICAIPERLRGELLSIRHYTKFWTILPSISWVFHLSSSKPSWCTLLHDSDSFHCQQCCVLCSTWGGYMLHCVVHVIGVEAERSFRVDKLSAGVGRSTLLWWEETRPAGCCRLLRGNLPHPAAVRRLSSLTLVLHARINQALSEYKHSMTFCIRRCVAVATKPVHRLQICPIVHNLRAPPTIPPSYIRVHAVLWECGEGQTHRRLWPLYISHCIRLLQNVIILT